MSSMFRGSASQKKKLKKNSLKSITSFGSQPSLNDMPGICEQGGADRLKLSWVRTETLDHGVLFGQAAMWSNTAYFKNGGSDEVLEYSYRTNTWVRLVPPPFRGFALVVLEGLVTAVGGYNSVQQDQNKLMSLVDGKWSEHYPPMPTSRHYAMATTSDHTLLVCGGCVGNNMRVTTVEVMDTQTRRWSKGAELPRAISSCSSCVGVVLGGAGEKAGIAANEVYLVGGFNSQGHVSSRVLTCKLDELLEGVRPIEPPSPAPSTPLRTGSRHSSICSEAVATPPATPTNGSAHHEAYAALVAAAAAAGMDGKEASPWRELAEAPLVFASCALVRGHLVTVGGMKKTSRRASGDVYRYNPGTNTWELVGNMPTPRYCTAAASSPDTGELMVVGGVSGQLATDCATLLEVATC